MPGGAELVRELYELSNSGEYERATEMLHPEVVLHQWEGMPDADTYEGREGFVRGLSLWLEGFQRGFQFAVEGVADVGDRAVMRIRLRGRGRSSGLELEQVLFHVWAFRDDMPSECWVFTDSERAWALARQAE